MDTEELIQEIIQNARKDRKRLEEVSDALVKVASTPMGEEDPLAKAAMAEQLARVTDSLSRSNQQLVELVKLGTKNGDGDSKGRPISESEKEDLFDAIQAPAEEQ